MMKRKRARNRNELDAPMVDRITIIKGDHPLWRYRRIWAYMRYRDGIVIGKNRVFRLMKKHQLLVQKNHRLRAKRTSTRPKPRATQPNQYWGMDMTKIKLIGWGWVYVHLVLDWCTKEIIGTSISHTSNTNDWLDALNNAVSQRFPNGIHLVSKKPSLITDNGCQPTSTTFMKDCAILGIKQIFTTWNNPKGNADTERVFRTMKEDLVWPNEWHLPFQFANDFTTWVHNYNTDFPHQSLKYNTPSQFMHYFHRKEVNMSSKPSLIFA